MIVRKNSLITNAVPIIWSDTPCVYAEFNRKKKYTDEMDLFHKVYSK